MPFQLLFSDPRRPAFLLGLASFGALAGAFTFQAFGFMPCELCLAQRWPFALVLLLALVTVRLSQARSGLVAILVVMAAALSGNSGLALYHTGVEQHWWANAFDCGATALGSASIADLKAQLMATDFVPCDRVPWSLFGISIAGFNVMISGALGLFAAFSARLVARR